MPDVLVRFGFTVINVISKVRKHCIQSKIKEFLASCFNTCFQLKIKKISPLVFE